MIIDHVVNTKNNLGYVKSKIRQCAIVNVPEDQDGIELIKIKKVCVNAEEEGRKIIQTELVIILRCTLVAAHKAIFRLLNQQGAAKLRLGVYVFDKEACVHPDRTMRSYPLDDAMMHQRFRHNRSIMVPILKDVKMNRARASNRRHKSNISGGYPMENLVGEFDIPSYSKALTSVTIPTTSNLRTREEPPGFSLGERGTATSRVNQEYA